MNHMEYAVLHLRTCVRDKVASGASVLECVRGPATAHTQQRYTQVVSMAAARPATAAAAAANTELLLRSAANTELLLRSAAGMAWVCLVLALTWPTSWVAVSPVSQGTQTHNTQHRVCG
jgi:hypothetical protein